MAFRQYTQCVAPENHSSMNEYISATIQGLLAGGVGAAIAAIAGMPWCGLFGIEIAAMVWIIAFCQWWLYDRLICLGGDQSTIGMLVSTEPATGKEGLGAFDTDFSINLLQYDNQPGVTHPVAENRVPYGFLMKEQDATKNLGIPFQGEFATDQGTGIKSAIMHAEFEGAGIRDLMIGAQVGYALAVAALIACLAIPFPWGLIVAGILALLAFLALLIGGLLGLGDTGDPSDVDPNLGSLHTNDAVNGGIGADLLYVQGTWVFDTFHEGWNEIHPIKVCSKVGVWDGDWPDDWDTTVVVIEKGFEDAQSDETKAEQKRPVHGWTHHPDVDGCGEDEGPGPIE
jgi:hypothetical protein